MIVPDFSSWLNAGKRPRQGDVVNRFTWQVRSRSKCVAAI